MVGRHSITPSGMQWYGLGLVAPSMCLISKRGDEKCEDEVWMTVRLGEAHVI